MWIASVYADDTNWIVSINGAADRQVLGDERVTLAVGPRPLTSEDPEVVAIWSAVVIVLCYLRGRART